MNSDWQGGGRGWQGKAGQSEISHGGRSHVEPQPFQNSQISLIMKSREPTTDTVLCIETDTVGRRHRCRRSLCPYISMEVRAIISLPMYFYPVDTSPFMRWIYVGFLICIREGSRYQIGWIFGKIPKSLRSPPLVFVKLCCNFFMTDMVAFMRGGMMAR